MDGRACFGQRSHGGVMLNTISLSGHLLARAKRQSAHGMPRSAARTLGTLNSFRNQDPITVGESSAMLALLNLQNRHFRAARRYAKAALATSPSCPQYQYLCGCAWEKGAGADLQSAANWYLSCLEGQPNHLQARCALGLLRVTTGLVNEGIAILSEAWRWPIPLGAHSPYRSPFPPQEPSAFPRSALPYQIQNSCKAAKPIRKRKQRCTPIPESCRSRCTTHWRTTSFNHHPNRRPRNSARTPCFPYSPSPTWTKRLNRCRISVVKPEDRHAIRLSSDSGR